MIDKRRKEVVTTPILRRGRLLAAAGACALALAASAVPVVASDNGTVSATVTAAAPCITLDVSSVSFGTLPFNTANVLSGGAGVSPSYTNCASESEKVFARGTDASGSGAAWTLVEDQRVCPDPNRFGLDLQLPARGGLQIAIGKTNKELGTTAAGQRETTRPLIFMPCTGSSGAGQQMSMDIVYTATF